jgi:alkanesulfonate monooxygenase SsuD/methylene tetrahydromethanopterin reductase-like flavin-dependent oxidoreductase (luciferase family)
MIEGQQGLTWPRWQRLASVVDELGFAGLFRSDHFTDPRPPDRDALETVVSLAYLASQTKRIHFGPLVAPVSFRDPIQLAMQALAINAWSGGRMILGLGAGWQEREHTMFGYHLGDIPTRVGRFAEAMEVVSRLLRSRDPVTHDGRFYTLREARLLPGTGGTGDGEGHPMPLMIGGNGRRRTLPLTARYADIWNAVTVGPEEFRDLNRVLDELLRSEGREPDSLQRTIMTTLVFGQDESSLDERLSRMRSMLPAGTGTSREEQLDAWRNALSAIAGTPEAVIEQLRAYEAAGASEVMLQWLDMDDIEGLRDLTKSVLPAFKS